MIIYENTKGGFIDDVRNGYIADIVQESFSRLNLSHSNIAEHRAWANSLLYMRNVLDDDEISDDCK